MLYKTMGRIADAEKLIEQMMSLTIQYHGKNNTTYALALLNSAGIYFALNKYDQALTNYQEADRIYHQIYQTKINHGSSYALQNMASILEKQGDINEAENILLESARIKKKLFGGKNWNYALSMKALGMFYNNVNRFKESKKCLKEAIEIINYNYGDQSDKRFEFQYRLVRTQIKESPDEKYFGDYLDVMKFTIEKISLNLPFLNESEKKEFWDSRSKMFNHFYDYSINLSDSAKIYNVSGALYDLQLTTKSVLLNSMTKLRKDIERSNDYELKALFEKWTRKRNLFARATAMSIKEREEKLIDLDSLKNGINELEKELSVKSISFSRDTLSKSVSWRDIQSQLQPDEAAIELLKYKIPRKNLDDSICYAALIVTDQTPDKPTIVLFPNGNDMDKEDFKNYRKTLSQFKIDKLSYSKYWKPIQQQLRGTRKVYFSADGIYNLINLNTLYNPETGKYLIDELDIHLVTSTKDISLFSEDKLEFDKEMTAGLFGNPSYLLNESQMTVGQGKQPDKSQSRGDNNQLSEVYLRDFDILEQTEKEVKKIAAILKKNDLKVQTYLDSEALEEKVKSISKPTILHIATHGFFKDGDPVTNKTEGSLPMLSSGLVFAGVSDYYQLSDRRDKEDGILTAYECSTLDLAQTELVVLSACETGLGHLSNGEGVYGLQRGLKISGAKSVMMSLWKVNDLISQELMTTFYQEWMRTGNKLAAFRNAQQKLKEKYPHPYHWGGFVLIGENTILKDSGNNQIILIISIIGILLLSAFFFARLKR
ncbi:MAG: CHAT domain-containing tetratricopeptide repeat protein, partial [Bacteroidota bacterium]